MDGKEEARYAEGSSMAWRSMLLICVRELGYNEASHAAWIAEKEEIKQVLKEVCTDFGDTDYHDDLHLADVIEKHLHRHLIANNNGSTIYDWPAGLKEWLLSREEDIAWGVEDLGGLNNTFAVVIGRNAK